MDVIQHVAAELALSAEQRDGTARLLAVAEEVGAEAGIRFDEPARLSLANHLASLLQRLERGEALQGIAASDLAEVPAPFHAMAQRVIGPSYERLGQPVDAVEVGLVALHFAAAQERLNHQATGGTADE